MTDEISKALQLGLDIGGTSVLKAYQRKRRFDNLSLLMLIDGSARIFATKQTFLRRAFLKEFSILDRTETLKKYMMRHAMGLFDDFSFL